MKLGDRELYWLAGLLEGEGYFGTINSRVKGKLYRYPRIGLSMVDRDVVNRVGDMWGIKVQTVKNTRGRQPICRAYLIGTRAIDLMRQLYPLMGQRRRRMIELAIEEYERKGDPDERRRQWSRLAIKGRPRNADGTFAHSGEAAAMERPPASVGASSYRGVSWSSQKQKWCCKLTHHGESLHLGFFDSEIDAARVYDAKSRELRGHAVNFV